MRTHQLVPLLALTMLVGVVPAQELAAAIATARAHIDRRELEPAVALLLPLVERADSAADIEAVVTALVAVGEPLRERGQFAAERQAMQAILTLRLRLHGELDHVQVATSQSDLAFSLQSLGRPQEALPLLEAALAMFLRIHGDRAHPNVATTYSSIGACLLGLGRATEALANLDLALAMSLELAGGRDSPDVAMGLHRVAVCLHTLGRAGDALPKYRAALAMRTALHGAADHVEVARSGDNLGACLQSLGRADEALPLLESALAMLLRIHGERDDPDVARRQNNLASCLRSLGRVREALPKYEGALAMLVRLHGDRDHPDLAMSLNHVGACLQSLGRLQEALPNYEAALAMRRRMFGDKDHPDLATSYDNVALCLDALGRPQDAMPMGEAALAMWLRSYPDRAHPEVAISRNNVAVFLESLGRSAEALQNYEAALAMRLRVHGERDHEAVAQGHNNLAGCLLALGRAQEALPKLQTALAMRLRLYGDRDHAAVAHNQTGIAACQRSLGRWPEALQRYEAALAMRLRLYGERDHPSVAANQADIAKCLQALQRPEEAVVFAERSAATVERLRTAGRTLSMQLRQSYFDELKRSGVFEHLQQLQTALGKPVDAFASAERSRCRELLDLLEQQADPLVEAEQRARARGDAGVGDRIAALRSEIERATATSDLLLHESTRALDAEHLAAEQRPARLAELRTESDALQIELRRLLDERARFVADVVPAGKVRAPREVQAALRAGELLLEFTVSEAGTLLYVVPPEGEIRALPLAGAAAAIERHLPAMLQQFARHESPEVRGRDPSAAQEPRGVPIAVSTSLALFQALLPEAVFAQVKSCRRVWIAAHRGLHRLPFEALVTRVVDGKERYWLDDGPPIAYVPSASSLCWLRQRSGGLRENAALELLAIGDPAKRVEPPPVPEHGVFVVRINGGGEGARAGLREHDVLLAYDGKPLRDDISLRDERQSLDAAIQQGTRDRTEVPLQVWRAGVELAVTVRPGLLGIQVGQGPARLAREASLSLDEKQQLALRAGDFERLSHLPPLPGARAEVAAITAAFADAVPGSHTRALLGAEATESAVFELGATAKYLHFACHGIAEEYFGQSLSMLVLWQPQRTLPTDDGLLKLGDLLQRWGGRLSSCRLVVLSACRTNVGGLNRDDAPHALPFGFFYAGAPAVVSSLWSVADESTRVLMSDFYRRLLAGEKDRLAAFAAAKRALRATHPDPFHWAPFLYIGSPD